MTGQINDSVIFQRKNFSLAEFEGGNLFDPAKYGLEPEAFSSACWRGFVCTYKIYRKRLKLSDLSINIPAEQYEKLFKVLKIDFDPNAHEGELDYQLSSLSVDIEFSGKMLIGRDFAHEFYVHMGFQSAFAYGHVWSLEFDKGHLKKADDISLEMEDYRRSYFQKRERGEEPEDLLKWIEDAFSRRIRRKQ